MVLRYIVGIIFRMSYRSDHFCFCQGWGYDRKNIQKCRIFPRILRAVITQWLPSRCDRKNVQKSRIFPTILRTVITQWLPSRCDRKNVQKSRIFPTILRAVITQWLPWRCDWKNIQIRRIFPTITLNITHEIWNIKCEVCINVCVCPWLYCLLSVLMIYCILFCVFKQMCMVFVCGCVCLCVCVCVCARARV